MSEQKDLVGLNWVKAEVEQSLAEVRQALDAYLEQLGDTKRLIFCQARLHQIQGALKILPQKGASLLADELLAVTDALIKNKVSNTQLAAESLIQGGLQLQAYIEKLMRTGNDPAYEMFELLNSLRSLRYCSRLNHFDFFQPDFGESLPPLNQEQLDHLVDSGVIRLIRKIRQKYQVCLASYLRGEEPEQSLGLISKLFGKLQNLCWGSPSSPLWEASSALIEGLSEKSITADDISNNLLKELDSQLKQLVESRGIEINQPPGKPLFKKLLFLIAKAKSDNRLITTQKQRYKLDAAMPQGLADTLYTTDVDLVNNVNESKEKSSLTSSPDLVEQSPSVVDGIHKIAVLEAKVEVEQVSKAIADYVRSEWHKEYLSKIPVLLVSVYNTLNMPPLTASAELVGQLSQYIEATWMGDDQQPTQKHIAIVQKVLELMINYFNTLTQGGTSEAEKHLVHIGQELAELTKKPASFEPPSLSGISAEQLMVIPTPATEVYRPVIAKEPESKPRLDKPGLEDEPPKTAVSLSDDEETKPVGHVSVFVKTANNVQDELQEKFSLWEKNPQYIEPAKVMRRAFHTLKSSARASGASVMGELASAIENMLNRLLNKTIKPNSHVVSLLNSVITVLPELTQDFADENQLLTPEVLLFMEQADDLARGEGFFDPDELAAMDDVEVTPESVTDSKQTPAQFSPTELLLQVNIDHVLTADAMLQQWLTEISQPDLNQVKNELSALSEKAEAAKIEPLMLLSNVLIDVFRYLSQHERKLPKPLLTPLQEGFETLIDLMNQAAAKQIITPPQSIFSQIKHSLEEVLHEKNRRRARPEVDPEQAIPEEIVLAASSEKIKHFAKDKVRPSKIAPAQEETELVQVFLEEASDLIERSAQTLDSWMRYDNSLRPVSELQRNLHTLKGGARMVEFDGLGDLSHALESVYEAIATGQRESGEAPLGLLKQSHDVMEMMLQAIQHDRPAPSPAEFILQLEKWSSGKGHQPELPDYLGRSHRGVALSEVVPVDSKKKNPSLEQAKKPDESRQLIPQDSIEKSNAVKINADDSESLSSPLQDEKIRITSELIEQLVTLTDESGIQRSQVEQQMADIALNLNEMEVTTLRLKEQLRRLDIETQTQILSKYGGETDEQSDFDPLEMDKYSELTQLSNALVESASDLIDLRQSLQDKSRTTEGLLLQQSRTQSQLQSELLKIRLVPFNLLLPRLQKTVQQLSNELVKPVELKVKGADVKVDRIVLDKIQAPIEHILRNAIAHGIEDNEQIRLNSDKPAVGQLVMSLSCEGAYLTVDILDDGKGVNFAAIREKAIEKDLISSHTEPDESTLLYLMMAAGFSTASEVTQFSGRGVGLDVVSNEVRKLGGSIQIESKKNQGTRFVLQLPFRSTVSRALMVEESGYFYAIPMQSIDSLIMADPDDVLESYRSGSSIEHGGIKHQLISFGQLLGLTPTPIQTERCPIIIIQRGGENVALHVDTVHGGREVIAKSLGRQFKNLNGVNGATILGEGQVVVIIDPVEMIRMHYDRLTDGPMKPALPEVMQARKTCRILIVDDSITMEKSDYTVAFTSWFSC